MQTIAVLFHLFHSPVGLPFHPIQGKRRKRLHDVLPIKIHCSVQTLARNEFAKWRRRTYRYRVKCPYVVLS